MLKANVLGLLFSEHGVFSSKSRNSTTVGYIYDALYSIDCIISCGISCFLVSVPRDGIRGTGKGDQSLSVSVCVRFRTLKGKRLELSTSNLVDV